MDNKFLLLALALVWVVGVALVATLVYALGDLLKWLAERVLLVWRAFAPDLGAGCAIPVRVRGLKRINLR